VLFRSAVVDRGGEDTQPETLELHTVNATSFDITVTSSGELVAKEQTEIRSEVETQAAIVELVEEGTRVQKGDLLVQLNSEPIETQIDDQVLTVETARSDYITAENSLEIQKSENEAALRQARLALELARIELNKWLEGDKVKRIEELDTAIEKAERTLDRDEEKFEKAQRLYEKGFLSYDEFKTDEISFEESKANLEIARLNKRVFLEYEEGKTTRQLSSDVEEAEAELERVKRQNESRLVSKQADYSNKKRQLELREERLAKLKDDLEACTMRAPTDGLVVYATSIGDRRRRASMGDGAIEIGRNIRPNELIMILPDTSRMQASVKVHESIAGRIEQGQPANIRVEALPNATLNGTVESVGVLAESGGWRDPNLREYTVKIDINPEDQTRELKPAMRCETEIVLGQVNDSLATPIQSVHRDGPVSYVYTPEGARFRKTPVMLGRRSNMYVEIRKGLEAGDRVLLRQPTTGEIIKSEFDESTIAQMTPQRSRGGPPRGDGASQSSGATEARSDAGEDQSDADSESATTTASVDTDADDARPGE